MNLLKLFNLKPAEKRDYGQLFERIAELGKGLTEIDLKEITAIAGLCGRIAYADTEITTAELSSIRSILLSESKLSQNAVDIVIALLVEQRVEMLTLEEHFYTRLANESMDETRKRVVLKSLFQIAAADGTICLAEENLLFNLASQLKLSRHEIVALKREFKDSLSVFQGDGQDN